MRDDPSEPSDADLVRASRTGDMQALGVLMARHQASMRAVAISILGCGADADDAVQEAAVVAVSRLGDVRDPATVGAWLRAVVRNACKMQARRRTATPLTDAVVVPTAHDDLDPSVLLERQGTRDWVWHAMAGLSTEVQLAAVLRYFTGVTSYSDIAHACDIPLGTVRSRLSQARRQLHAALLRTADQAHDDVGAVQDVHRGIARATLRAAETGHFRDALVAHWHHDVATRMPSGLQVRGVDYLARAMDRDLSSGVRQRLTNVVAGHDVVVWEADLINPPDDPLHCPPAVAWIQTIRDGRVTRLRLVHAARPDGTHPR